MYLLANISTNVEDVLIRRFLSEEQVALKGRQIKRLLEPVLPENSFDDSI